LVVRLAPEKADQWETAEVLARWGQIFEIPPAVAQHGGSLLYRAGLTDWISLYRERLSSLSWFMRCINEPLARRSNQGIGAGVHLLTFSDVSEAELASSSRERRHSNIRAAIGLAAIDSGIATNAEIAAHFKQSQSGLSRAISRLRTQLKISE
jgi:hypothetical protein